MGFWNKVKETAGSGFDYAAEQARKARELEAIALKKAIEEAKKDPVYNVIKEEIKKEIMSEIKNAKKK